MAILSIQTSQTGTVGVLPSIAYIATTNTEVEVLATGFLNNAVASGIQFSLPCLAEVSTATSPSAQPDVGWYEIKHVGANWSLVPSENPGDVVLPTIANHIAVFTNTTGTLGEDAAIAINGGNIQAGLSGTAGYLASFPATAARGSLRVTAVANTGNTLTTLSNVAMGQASVVSIPDPVNALGRLLIGATATPFVSGNFPVNSGTGGLMVDSGIAASQLMQLNAVNTLTGSGQIVLVKANGVEASNLVTASGNAGVITTSSLNTAGGATYAITWTNTKITTASVLSLCIQGGTNTTQNITFTCVPGSGTATLTIFNNTAATALNGTILIGYTVL